MAYISCLVVLAFAILSAASADHGRVHAEHEDLYSELLKRVVSLEKRDAQQQAEIDNLRTELMAEKQKTGTLEGIIQELKQENVNQENAKALILPNMPGILEEDQSENVKEEQGEGGPRIRQSQPEVVAFHAVLTNHVPNIGLHHNIAFNHVITNIGGAYNSHFGSFVAPVTGVYVFSSTVMGLSRDEFQISILRNGASVGNLHVRNIESPFQSNSAMVVLQLTKGDDMAIQSQTNNIALNGDLHSMFSGFLLIHL